MDIREMLDPFERMLESCCAPAAVRQIDAGGAHSGMWATIEGSGYLQALVSEDHDGFGLSLSDVAPLLMALGRYAVPLPVGETLIARGLLAGRSDKGVTESIALATRDTDGAVFVPYGMVCDLVLVDNGRELKLHSAAQMQPIPTGVHASLDAWFDLPQVDEVATTERPIAGLRSLGALVSATAISGAADRLLDMTTAYANERVQFGKPIGRQQALQQQLAVMAEDVIAVRLAVELACQGSFPPTEIAAATAKIIASKAAVRIASTAHAVFGAMGISEEHDLQLFTRRLHNWRQAFGSEHYWQVKLGAARLQSGARSVDWVRETYGC